MALICSNYAVKNFLKWQNKITKKHKPINFLIVELNTRLKMQTLGFEKEDVLNS